MIRNNLFKKIYRKKTIKRISKKCKLLGVNNKIDVFKFLNLRLITTIIIFILLLLFNDKGYVYAPLISILFYISFEYYLDYKIKIRIEKLNYEAIFFFQVLVLTLESGKNLESAISLTVDNIESELSQEFKKTLDEIRLGKSLAESLLHMKERIPSNEINTVLLNIRESTIFGNNIIDSLNNQIDYLRDRKILTIKGKINKMPLKISIVSVIFMIPIIMLLLLGPVLINFLAN